MPQITAFPAVNSEDDETFAFEGRLRRPVALRNINRKDLLWGLFPSPMSNRQTSRLDFDSAPKSDVVLDLAGTFFGFGIIPGCA